MLIYIIYALELEFISEVDKVLMLWWVGLNSASELIYLTFGTKSPFLVAFLICYEFSELLGSLGPCSTNFSYDDRFDSSSFSVIYFYFWDSEALSSIELSRL